MLGLQCQTRYSPKGLSSLEDELIPCVLPPARGPLTQKSSLLKCSSAVNSKGLTQEECCCLVSAPRQPLAQVL